MNLGLIMLRYTKWAVKCRNSQHTIKRPPDTRKYHAYFLLSVGGPFCGGLGAIVWLNMPKCSSVSKCWMFYLNIHRVRLMLIKLQNWILCVFEFIGCLMLSVWVYHVNGNLSCKFTMSPGRVVCYKPRKTAAVVTAIAYNHKSTVGCKSFVQEAQLPQRDSASATHVFVGSLTDRAIHWAPHSVLQLYSRL